MKIQRTLQCALSRATFVVVIFVVVCCLVVLVCTSLCDKQAHVLLAAAAFVASITAIFGLSVRDWVWRPVLKVNYVHGPDYCEAAVLRGEVKGAPVKTLCHYFSLRVSNAGARRAETIEVFAKDLRKVTDSGTELIRRYSLDLKWAYIGVPRLPTLLPKMERFCNIGHVIRPNDRWQFANEDLAEFDSGQTVFSLDLEAQPNHGIHLLEPGKYELSFCVVAANHRPIDWFLRIDLTGKWSNDLPTMLVDGIRIGLHKQPIGNASVSRASTPT